MGLRKDIHMPLEAVERQLEKQRKRLKKLSCEGPLSGVKWWMNGNRGVQFAGGSGVVGKLCRENCEEKLLQ